jgi:hypothetical protein
VSGFLFAFDLQFWSFEVIEFRPLTKGKSRSCKRKERKGGGGRRRDGGGSDRGRRRKRRKRKRRRRKWRMGREGERREGKRKV